MTTVYVLLLVLITVLLLLVVGAKPSRSLLSRYELERRIKADDKGAKQTLRRESLLSDVYSLQRILSALLLVVFSPIAIIVLGWVFGIILSLLLALEYVAIARLKPVRSIADRLYIKIEPKLLDWIEKFEPVFKFIRGREELMTGSGKVASVDELVHIIEQSDGVLTKSEQKLLIHAIQFEDKLVSDVMTPRSVIDSVDRSEVLGPLMLDQLHKTGHSRFPVVDGDIDHVIGMIYLNELVQIERKKSLTAEKAMSDKVYYIREDQTLGHALNAFIRTHHHLFIVVNEYRETVGVISLEDVIERILGRQIIDEFDAHDDLRVVAARNPRANNTGGKDV